MTIAQTGNKIVDQIARAKSKNQADERRAKTKAAKSGKSLGRMRKVAAGRKAAKSGRGRGIVGKVQKSGRGFKGILNYACDKPGAQIIDGSESTKADAQRDMILCAGLRPSVKNPVGHITLSLPPSTKADDDRWREIICTARAEIGLDDSYTFIAVRHNDTDHDHVHIIFSRINDRGEIFDDYRLGLRLALCEDVIEDRFGLPLIPRPPTPTPPLKKGEIEKAIRTGQQPERMRLFDIVHRASSNQPTVVEFVQKCAADGVVVRPNLASTGRLNGFSFSLAESGLEFKGAQLKASWADLQSKGVTYVQNRDFAPLAELASAITAGQRTIEPAPADIGKMEGTLSTPAIADRSSEEDHRAPANPDRPAQKTPFVSGSLDRMLELNRRRSARRIFFADLRTALTKIGRPAAARLADALDADKTETEIAEAFIAREKCSSESRELILRLNLPKDQIAEILRPWAQQIKMEADASARMADAIRSAPTPDTDLHHGNSP
ncbi:relaxase/mobilization nuclease domain-containing protein [Sideroxyarcus sp. TK5]